MVLTAPAAFVDMPEFTQPVTEVDVVYSEAMNVASVTNTANYDFERDGVDVSINSIQYDPVTNTASLQFNTALSQGDYELYVDASTIVAADGDAYRGDDDVAVGTTNSLFGKLPIRRGDGDLSFTTIDTLNAGRNLGTIKPANLNSDNFVDFVVQQVGRDWIYLYLSNGAGGYNSPLEFNVGDTAVDLAIGDLNGDNIDDIALPNLFGSLTVMFSTGFGQYTTQDYLLPDRVKSAVIGDFDENGGNDIGVSVENAGLVVFYNSGTSGDFSNQQTFAANIDGDLAVGDVQGDGILEIAAAGQVDRSVTVFAGIPGQGFDIVTVSLGTTSPTYVGIGEFTGDGVGDVAYVSSSNNEVGLVKGLGSSQYEHSATTRTTGSQNPSELAVGDFNRDGIDEAIVSTDNSAQQGVLSIFPGSSQGLSPRITASAGIEGLAGGVAVGEFVSQTIVGGFTVDSTAPSISHNVPGQTSDTTPQIAVTTSDNELFAATTTIYVDVDLNNDGDFVDQGETDYTTVTRTGAVTTFDITPALGIGTYGVQTRIQDQAGNESTTPRSTMTIVSPNNDPTATDDSFNVEQNAVDVVLDVLRNDSTAPDEDEVPTIIQVSAPSAGGAATIAHDGLSIRYSPPTGFTGTETLTYTISDGNGGNDVATVTINVVSPVANVASVSIQLSDLSGEPIAAIPVGQEFALELVVQDNRQNATGLFAAFVDLFYSSSLVETVGDPSPGPGFTNGFSFDNTRSGLNNEAGGFGGFTSLGAGEHQLFRQVFKAISVGEAVFATDHADELPQNEMLFHEGSDPVDQLATALGQAMLTIHAAVTANDDSFTVDEDSTNNSLAIISNDLPEDGSITIQSVGPTSAGGVVSISANGLQAVYTPAADYSGSETFSYTIIHTNGATDAATVTVTVTNLNDPPRAGDDLFLDVLEDSVNVQLDVLDNDDPAPDQGETIAVTIVGTPDQGGTVAISPGGTSVTYTPKPDFFGVEKFTYTISDGNGGTAQATVTIDVVNVNDDPTAVADSYSIVRGSQDNELFVLANDLIAPDRNEILVIVAISATSAGGTAAIAPDGKSIMYTPPNDFSGNDVFSYTIDDGNGGSSQTDVTILVYSAWTHPTNQFDVDNNGFVTPRDALLLINELNANGARQLPDPTTVSRTPWLFLDPNGDGFLTPGDVLVVINYLNGGGQGEGEGSWGPASGQRFGAVAERIQAKFVDPYFGVEFDHENKASKGIPARSITQADSTFSPSTTDALSDFEVDALEDLIETLSNDVDRALDAR